MAPWLTTLMITLIGSGIFFALAAFVLAWWLDDQYGEQVSKRLLGYAMSRLVTLGAVVIGLLLVITVALAAAYWRWVTVGVCLLGLGALWGLIGLWIRDRQRKGRVFLTLRSPQAKSGIGVSVFLVLAGGALVIAGGWNRDVIWILQGIYLLSFAAVELGQVRCPTLITEHGIYAPAGSIRWEQIQNCQWQGGTNEFSALMVQTQRWFLNRQLIRIPWDSYERVDRLLGDCLDEGIWVEPLDYASLPSEHVRVHPIVESNEKGPVSETQALE